MVNGPPAGFVEAAKPRRQPSRKTPRPCACPPASGRSSRWRCGSGWPGYSSSRLKRLGTRTSSAKASGGTNRVPSASTRLRCGGERNCRRAARPAGAGGNERGAAVLGRGGVEVQHRRVAAQRQRIGVRARFAFAGADHLHAVVVQAGAVARGFHPQLLRAGGLAHQRLDVRQLGRVQRGDAAQPGQLSGLCGQPSIQSVRARQRARNASASGNASSITQ